MVRARQSSCQDGIEDGLARILNFDNEVGEEELEMIPESLVETTDQMEQPERSPRAQSEEEGNSQDTEVPFDSYYLPNTSYFSLA